MEDTMIGYIEESGNLVRKNTSNSVELTKAAVDAFVKGDYNRILIIASGSSYNGACGARYFMERILKIKVDLVSSYTFLHCETIFDKKTFVFGAGQSGRSVNTNEALDKAREAGLVTVGLTGNVEAVMKDHCDIICNWGMGIEKIGFVTKGVATLTAFLDLFAVETAKRLQKISADEYNRYKDELIHTSHVMDEMVETSKAWYKANEDELTDLRRVQIAGYGTSHATALEGALKIAETTGHAATGYELEEFLHGPAIEIEPENHTVFIIDSNGTASDHANVIYNSIHHLTKRVFYITNRKVDDSRACVLDSVVPEYFSSIVNNIPFQVISAYGRDKWVNPMDEQRKIMNDEIGYKSPKTGKELGL